MAQTYSDQENEEYAEAQRIDVLRREGMGISPRRPGETPLLRAAPKVAPRSLYEPFPPRPGAGQPLRLAPELGASRTNPTVLKSAGAEPGSRMAPFIRDRAGAALASVGSQQLIQASAGAKATDLKEAALTEAAVGEGASFAAAEDATMGEAVKDGFAVGFTNTLGSQLSPVSPLAGLVQIAEAAEGSTTQSAALRARTLRFPELQGVEPATGNAARFPELVERPSEQGTQQTEQDGDYDR